MTARWDSMVGQKPGMVGWSGYIITQGHGQVMSFSPSHNSLWEKVLDSDTQVRSKAEYSFNNRCRPVNHYTIIIEELFTNGHIGLLTRSSPPTGPPYPNYSDRDARFMLRHWLIYLQRIKETFTS